MAGLAMVSHRGPNASGANSTSASPLNGSFSRPGSALAAAGSHRAEV